jgi:hypothetical protein
MARSTPHVVSTRLSREQLACAMRYANTHGITVAALAREALERVTRAGAGPADLNYLIPALGLPQTASADQVALALLSLAEEVSAGPTAKPSIEARLSRLASRGAHDRRLEKLKDMASLRDESLPIMLAKFGRALSAPGSAAEAAEIVADVAEALGLDKTAEPRAVLEALGTIVDDLEAPAAAADPLDEHPEPPPEPAAFSARAEVAKLSREMQTAIKARGMTPEEFIEARNSAVRRAPTKAARPAPKIASFAEEVAMLSKETRAELKRRGMSIEDYVARKRAAVRRA